MGGSLSLAVPRLRALNLHAELGFHFAIANASAVFRGFCGEGAGGRSAARVSANGAFTSSPELGLRKKAKNRPREQARVFALKTVSSGQPR